MKRSYIISCFLLLLFACSKEGENDTLLESTSRDINFCVNPSVSSGDGEIIVSKAEATTSQAGSGDTFRLGLYQNDDTSTPYPNTTYNNIKTTYDETNNAWQYSLGGTSDKTDAISLSLDEGIEKIKVVGCCWTNGYAGTTYIYVDDNYDIAKIPISSSTITSSTTSTTTWYMASSVLDVSSDSGSNGVNTSSVDLIFKPVFAILKLNLKLTNSQSGVEFRRIRLNSTLVDGTATSKIVTGGTLNCSTGTISRNYSNYKDLWASTSSALSVTNTGTTYYAYMVPNADTDSFTSLTMNFIFDDYDGSYYENSVELVSTNFTRFESGKIYNLSVEIDNYGQFSDITFDTEWQESSDGDIGTSI